MRKFFARPLGFCFLAILAAGLCACAFASASAEAGIAPSSSPSVPPAPSASPTPSPAPTPTPTPTPDPDSDLFFCAPKEQPGETSLHIYKSLRRLDLIADGQVIGRFKIGLGGQPVGDKEIAGDLKTPEGEFYICGRRKHPISDDPLYSGRLTLVLSYPNAEDAERGLEQGIIGKKNYQRILSAIKRKSSPPMNTKLGGSICIHTGSADADLTEGCIALSAEDMEILWEYTQKRTAVIIEA